VKNSPSFEPSLRQLREEVFVNLPEQIASEVRRDVGEILEQLVWDA